MADNKKYYYLKLKDNFYETDAMIILESMENGYLYSNILMKMYLRSLKNDGKLMFNDKIPYNPQMLSKIVRHNSDIVEKAIKLFKELELIDILDNGAIYMSDIQNYIGESSTEADRIRQYRTKIDNEKYISCTNVQQLYDKSTPEIEKEKEIKKEINIKKDNISKIVTDFCEDKQLQDNIFDFIDMRKKIKAPMTDRAIKLLLNKLSKYKSIDLQIQVLEQSIINGWKDIYDLKQDKKDNNKQNGNIFLQIAKEEGMF